MTTDNNAPASAEHARIKLTFCGRTLSIRQWAEVTGLPCHVIAYRMRAGWTADKVLSEPLRSSSTPKPSTKRLFTFRGKSQSLSEWSRELKLGYGTITARLRKGWTVEEALSTRPIPVAERGRAARHSNTDPVEVDPCSE